MKTRPSFLKLVWAFSILSLLFTQCKNDKKAPSTNPAFTNYISAFTGGVISNESTIKIRLSESIPDAKPKEIVNQRLFNFKPNIEGEAFWTDDQTIEFIPSSNLDPGKLYEASFSLGKTMNVPTALKTFTFHFQVMKQDIELEFEGIQAYDKQDLTWQKVKGQVYTYDFANSADLETSVKAFQNGNELFINWNHESDGKSHSFIIDSVKRTESQQQVIIEWDGKKLGIDKKDEKAFDIPPLSDFKILNVNVSQQPKQMLTIYFSDPIDPNQDFEGLIYLQSGQRCKIVKEHSAVKLYPNTQLKGKDQLIVNQGIKNRMGYSLKNNLKSSITFHSIKPAIELIGKGVILPSSQGLTFPFKTVNLSAVNMKIIQVFEKNISQFLQVNQLNETSQLKRVGRVVYKGDVQLKSDKPIDYGTWNNFSIDLSSYITAEPGALYRVILSCKKHHSLYDCENEDENEEIEEDTFLSDDEFDEPSNSWYFYDYDDNFYYNGNYKYSDRENPCKPSYYMVGERTVARNIMASNLGIIAKSGQGSNMTIAITDLITTKPKAGVNVEFYNFQRQLIESKKTDANGLLNIDLRKKPFLLIAKNGDDRGYLRLDDGSALSLSMFDIGGQKNKKGLKGIIYGERGVWRPGDSLFLTFVLEDKEKVLPENHPVIMELYTPQQQLYKRIVESSSLNGFYNFTTITAADAPTGNWTAKVKVGGSIFSKSLKIESVKPNRLKINLDFHEKILTNLKKPKGDLEVKWLHGAPASNLKVDIELNFNKAKTAFKEFKEYTFDDPSKEFHSQEKMIFDAKVDQDGKAIINTNFQDVYNAPGMLKAYFKLRAFEKGGEFSVDRFSIPYSPYRGYIGLKIPDGEGWNGALYSNEANLIPIVSVDEQGNPVDRKGVKIEIYNVYWRWWWERSSDDDLSRFVANKSQNLIKTATIDTKNGKALFEMNLDGRYYGRKFIKIIDPVTGHSAGQTFYTTYKGWWNNNGDAPGGAEMLSFTTDKKKYEVGEDITVNIPTTKQGRMLVSVEKGSKILKTFWVEMTEDKKSFQIESSPEMAPNVYINLTFIQAHNNVENDLPIRLYGVQSVSIENPESHIKPIIDMPNTLAPEENFTVTVSEENGNNMTYTLAVVDDGLLDLTRFRTPNLWSHFNAREALSVHTWDMYKYVMGAFTGKMAGLLALGGDEEAAKDKGTKANRFKPVVSFLGPFELSVKGKNKHEIKMPNYVGSVRTMVIAANDVGYGSAEKTCPVKKPLMVLATLPRVIGPGEKVELPVTVFAMDKKIKDVTVTVETNSFINIEGEAQKTINFTKEGDQLVSFSLNVAKTLGIGTVKLIAKSGNEEARYEVELDVRAPNPRITEGKSGFIKPGETWESEYIPIGISGTNKGVLELSSLPPLNLEKRLQYLIKYPHGCIEQTTSSVFPQLFLENLLELNLEQKQKVEDNIKAAIEKMRSFQLNSGGFSYWPGESGEAHRWGTNYAGHFLVEAQAKGYSLPPFMLSKWIEFQKQSANNWTNEVERYSISSHQLTQAYRLYTLALAKSPALGAMNRLKNLKSLSLAAAWRLAAAYYLIGKKDIAQKMTKNLNTDIKDYEELSYSFGNSIRDKAMILETLSYLEEKAYSKIILEELSKKLSSNGWYSTQTTAYSLLAISKFLGNESSGEKAMKYSYILNSAASKSLESTAAISQIELGIKEAKKGHVSIKNTGDKTLFINLQLEGIPSIGDETNFENNLIMKLKYMNLAGEEIDPTSLTQGMDFMVETTVKHPGLRDDYKEMALTQIFPSGWEIRNMRMDQMPFGHSSNQPKYMDIRDDRVYSYFDLRRGESKTFRLLLNASYLGEYYLPTIYCQAMYNNEITARKAGKWVKVVRASDAK